MAKDNACVGSFFDTLKKELVHDRLNATREEAKQGYLRMDRGVLQSATSRSTLGYRSQAEFEAMMNIA